MEDRSAIFAVHLRKRRRDPDEFDLQVLAACSDGYSGAEIESAVKAALLEAFEDCQRALRTEDIVRALSGIRPLAQVKPNEIEDLRRWARDALAIDANRGTASRRRRRSLARTLILAAGLQDLEPRACFQEESPYAMWPRARLTAYVAYQTLAFAERDVLLAALADAGYSRVETAPAGTDAANPVPVLDSDRRVVGGAAMVVRREHLAMGFGDLGFVLTDGAYVPLVPSDARSPTTAPDSAYLLRARESDTAGGAGTPPLRRECPAHFEPGRVRHDPRQVLSWRTLMAEMIITVSPDGELVVRSEGLTRAQWEQATAELRAVLGEPTRQAIEAEQHVHHTEVHGRIQPRA